MGKTPNITWNRVGELLVICPQCGANHQFSQVAYEKMILDGNFDDDFEISSSSVGYILWPPWVCRNSSCDNVAMIKLPRAINGDA
jgi:hypothetical protein